MMIRKIWPLMVVLSAVAMLSSCLGNDDDDVDNSYTYYNDAGIVSFSLGTMKQYRDTVAKDGSDSTYFVHIVGKSFPFVIDHVKGQIYNPDSLPFRTDVSRVVVTATTRNSALIYIKRLPSDTLGINKDSLVRYDATDSLDLRQPRVFRCLSLDGTGWRKYDVKVNVHQQSGDDFHWNRMADQPILSSMTAMKAVVLGDSLYVFGRAEGSGLVLGGSRKDGNLRMLTPDINTPIAADAYQGVVTMGRKMYFVNKGIVLSTPDGIHYEQKSHGDNGLVRLVAASRKELFALTTMGHIVCSRDEGSSWTETTIGDDKQLMPTEIAGYTCQPVRTNDEVDRILIVGKLTGRKYAASWTKITDYNDTHIVYPWTYVDVADDNRYALQAYNGLTITAYNDGALAFGTDAEGRFSQLLYSKDGGITWKPTETQAIPSAFQTSAAAFTGVADADNYIWLLNSDGQLWRGRLDRLAWKK